MSHSHIYIVYLRCPELKEMCWVGSAFKTYDEARACVAAQTEHDTVNNYLFTEYKIAEIPFNLTIFTNDDSKRCPVVLN